MFVQGVGHVTFNLHLGVGISVLSQLEKVGHVFFNHNIFQCSAPSKLYFLTVLLLGLAVTDDCKCPFKG